MLAYIVRRVLLIFPTLIGIMLLNFLIVQAAPGGPIESLLIRMESEADEVAGRLGADQDVAEASGYRGREGLPPELIEKLEEQWSLSGPWYERFGTMVANYLTFDFGDSYFRDVPVVSLVAEKLPVSITLGLWSTLFIYLISIPLGVMKAVHDGSRFDGMSSTALVLGYAVPGWMMAIFLIVFLAGGRFLDIFPMRGLGSPDWDELSLGMRALDYLWHIALPVFSLVIGGFATLTFLTKNSFLDEINKQYVITARAKGLTEQRVLYGHVFRNAMLIVIAGFPGAFIEILFTGSLLIEVIFSLDGLGLLGFEAAINRDYAVIFATVYVFSLLGLAMNLISDLTYVLVDPRIDFEARRT